MSPEAPIARADTPHLHRRFAALEWMRRRTTSASRPSAEDTEFMSETSAAVLEGPRFFTHWILWATLAFFIVALGWAAIAKVDEFTVAEGKVIPSSQVQVVQNLEGGILSEILVQAGQVVEKGQILMRIDDTRFVASAHEGQAKDHALLARIARLTAETGNTAFAPERQLEKAMPKLVAEESALHSSRQKQLNANELVLRQQAEQRRLELDEKRARAAQLQESLSLVDQELSMTRPLVREGVVSQVEVLRLERQASDLRGERDAARLAIPRLESAHEEVRRKVDELRARFRADANEELNKVRGEQNALSAANTALDDRVTRTAVRAPLAGIVKQVKVSSVGGVIQPGMDLLEIVPLEDTLLVEARVRPADIAFLQPGQEAMVKLSAYDYSIYGGFPASLEHISADTLTTDKPGERPESYYQVRVRTKNSRPTAGPNMLSILPGMVATVDIKTGQKTILHYLLKPIIKTKEMALRER
jgi:membrane fusion protein, adhesin transport system